MRKTRRTPGSEPKCPGRGTSGQATSPMADMGRDAVWRGSSASDEVPHLYPAISDIPPEVLRSSD